MPPCEVRRLALVTYENGMRMQEKLVSLRQQDKIPDQLLLLQHFPVITLGRGGDPSNLLASSDGLAAAGVRFYETTRGGDITYHGPGPEHIAVVIGDIVKGHHLAQLALDVCKASRAEGCHSAPGGSFANTIVVLKVQSSQGLWP